jgi:hypothetical protein
MFKNIYLFTIEEKTIVLQFQRGRSIHTKRGTCNLIRSTHLTANTKLKLLVNLSKNFDRPLLNMLRYAQCHKIMIKYSNVIHDWIQLVIAKSIFWHWVRQTVTGFSILCVYLIQFQENFFKLRIKKNLWIFNVFVQLTDYTDYMIYN